MLSAARGPAGSPALPAAVGPAASWSWPGRMRAPILLLFQVALAYGVFATVLEALTVAGGGSHPLVVASAAGVAAGLLTSIRAGRERMAAVMAGLAAGVSRVAGARWFSIALLTGIALRSWWLWQATPAAQVSDPGAYFELARQLVEQGVYRSGTERAFWPPGLPFSLAPTIALLGARPWVPGVNNLLWFAATLWCVRALGARLGSRPMVAVALVALWPTSILATGVAAKELLLAFLQPLALVLYLRTEPASASGTAWSLAAGLALGAAVLTQPLNLVLPAAFVVFEWLRGATFARAWPRLGALAVGVMAVVLPWTARNYVVLGAAVPVSTNGGWVLLIGNNDQATGRYMKPPAGAAADEVAKDRERQRRAFDWIRTHPGKFARLVPLRQVAFLGDAGFGSYWGLKVGRGVADRRYLLARALEAGFWLMLLAICFASFSRARAAGTAPAALLLPVLCFFATMAAVSVGEGGGRFHLPYVPVLAAIAGVGIGGAAPAGARNSDLVR